VNWRMMWRILTTPGCWLRNYPEALELTAYLKACLDAGDEMTPISEHTSSFGGLRLWTSNYPYAYGQIYGIGGGMPSREVVFMLRDIQNPLDDTSTTARIHAAIVEARENPP